jgi:hypothetical protein
MIAAAHWFRFGVFPVATPLPPVVEVVENFMKIPQN